MDKKLALRCLIPFVVLFLSSVILLSCYEVKTEVIGPGEGIRVDNLPDGLYINEKSEDKESLKIKWEAAPKEYSLEMISKEGTTLSRVRVVPLHDSYLLAQIYNKDENAPYTLLLVTIEEKAIVVYNPEDSKLEAKLAMKTGAAQQEAEYWKDLKTAPAKNLRAFLKDLAASGTLQPSARYRYQGPEK